MLHKPFHFAVSGDSFFNIIYSPNPHWENTKCYNEQKKNRQHAILYLCGTQQGFATHHGIIIYGNIMKQINPIQKISKLQFTKLFALCWIVAMLKQGMVLYFIGKTFEISAISWQ